MTALEHPNPRRSNAMHATVTATPTPHTGAARDEQRVSLRAPPDRRDNRGAAVARKTTTHPPEWPTSGASPARPTTPSSSRTLTGPPCEHRRLHRPRCHRQFLQSLRRRLSMHVRGGGHTMSDTDRDMLRVRRRKMRELCTLQPTRAGNRVPACRGRRAVMAGASEPQACPRIRLSPVRMPHGTTPDDSAHCSARSP